MFGTNIASIFFYVVVGIIVLIVIPILLVWRHKESKNDNNRNKNVASKDLLRSVNSISKTRELETFYNVVVGERFRKQQFLHQPAGLISEKKLYLMTDIVKYNIKKTVIKGDNIEIITENNKTKLLKNIFLPEIFAFRKWIGRKAKIDVDEIDIVILHYGMENTTSANNVHFISVAQIYDFVNNKDEEQKKDINPVKIKKIINEKNIITPDNRKMKKALKNV